MLYKIILYANYAALFYAAGIMGIYLLQLLGASWSLSKYVDKLRYSDFRRYINSKNMIPISILVPAYNEEATIVENVKNLMNLDFPEYEVIVINDGSSDSTLKLLLNSFDMVKINEPYKKELETSEVKAVYRSPLYEGLVVVDKVNGGKADALNAGINISKYPIFISMDADSLLEKESLIRIVTPFVNDHKVAAVGGIVRISSGCEVKNGNIIKVELPGSFLGKLQTVEYLRAFFSGRIGAEALDMLLIISGAFGAFKKSTAVMAGGYTKGCIGEDMELVVKIHTVMREKKIPYTMKFLSDPICWTQPPENIRDLYKQRKRWQIGLVNTLMNHKSMLFNPKYGRIGLFTIPYYWIFEFIGPVLEMMGYILVPAAYFLGIVNLKFMITYLMLIMVIGIILSVGAITLESYTARKFPKVSQIAVLVLYAFIDNLGYRQFNTVVRGIGTIIYPFSSKEWGEMDRRSFNVKNA